MPVVSPPPWQVKRSDSPRTPVARFAQHKFLNFSIPANFNLFVLKFCSVNDVKEAGRIGYEGLGFDGQPVTHIIHVEGDFLPRWGGDDVGGIGLKMNVGETPLKADRKTVLVDGERHVDNVEGEEGVALSGRWRIESTGSLGVKLLERQRLLKDTMDISLEMGTSLTFKRDCYVDVSRQ